MSESLQIFRLEPKNPLAWAMFPVFESRVLAFVKREGVDAELEVFRHEVRGRFFHPQPETRRLYLFVDRAGAAHGHFYAWLDVAWGRPYIHVNQVDVDHEYRVTSLQQGMFREMDQWVDALNEGLPENAPRVDGIEMWTWHDPDVMARWLRSGCDLKVSRYVLRYSASERKKRLTGQVLQ